MTVEEIVEDQHDMETGVGLMTKSFFGGGGGFGMFWGWFLKITLTCLRPFMLTKISVFFATYWLKSIT